MEVTNPNENWNQPQAPQQENKKIAAVVKLRLVS